MSAMVARPPDSCRFCRRRSRRPARRDPVGLAAAAPGVAAAAPGADPAGPDGRGGRLRRGRRLQRGGPARSAVRLRELPPAVRRASAGHGGRRRRRPEGVRHRSGDRAPVRAHPRLGPDRRIPGPGPGRPLQPPDAGPDAGALPGRRRAGGRHRRGGPGASGPHRLGPVPARTPAAGHRHRREPQRPDRPVRAGAPVGRRPGPRGNGAAGRQPGRIQCLPPRIPRPAAVAGARRQHPGSRRGRRTRRRHGPDGARRPGRRRCLRRYRRAPSAPARHARGHRGDPKAASDGYGRNRSAGRHHRGRQRGGHRPGRVVRGRPAPGSIRRPPDRPVRRSLVPDRLGHAAGDTHGGRRGLVGRRGPQPVSRSSVPSQPGRLRPGQRAARPSSACC